MKGYDFAIIGAGVYGLYCARELGRKGYRVVVFERDAASFSRASYVNQARVHQGYHYPRSLFTAKESARFFSRFCEDFSPAINRSFTKIYALARRSSYTSYRHFLRFCEFCGIPAMEVDPRRYFNDGLVDGAYQSREYAFDAATLRDLLLADIASLEGVRLRLGTTLVGGDPSSTGYRLRFSDGPGAVARGVFNCAYASVNQVLAQFALDPFDVKYELCEVALARPGPALKDLGVTLMDGPFFSVMPFGNAGVHSITAVEYTPHRESYAPFPDFDCQQRNPRCTERALENCSYCGARPETAFPFMLQLLKKFMRPEFRAEYDHSLFAVKVLLRQAEVDDSRPTAIRINATDPLFVSVLSGKINTIYELDEVIDAL